MLKNVTKDSCEICVHTTGKATVLTMIVKDKDGFTLFGNTRYVDTPQEGIKGAEAWKKLNKSNYYEILITTNWQGS